MIIYRPFNPDYKPENVAVCKLGIQGSMMCFREFDRFNVLIRSGEISLSDAYYLPPGMLKSVFAKRLDADSWVQVPSDTVWKIQPKEKCLVDDVRLQDAEKIKELEAKISRLEFEKSIYEDYKNSVRGLVRELDVILNGDGAAQQAALVDLVAQAANGGLPYQQDKRRLDWLEQYPDTFILSGARLRQQFNRPTLRQMIDIRIEQEQST